MIIKRQNGLRKKQLLIVICASVLALLIAAYAVTGAVINAIEASKPEDENKKPEVDASLGEVVYGNATLVYSSILNSTIQSVDVGYLDEDPTSPNGAVKRHFSIKRPSKESEFIFYYTDSDNVARVYMPPISNYSGFDYTDLYAMVGSGTYSYPKVTLLLAAISTLAFDEKIELDSDPVKKAAQLTRYGFTEENQQTVVFSYLDNDGNSHSHKVTVGNLAIDGSGYYFTVDDRNVIYSTVDTSLDYALNGFVSFLHSRLTAQGEEGDAAIEPYVTQKYKQWKNTIHTDASNLNDLTVSGAKVIVSGSEEEYIYEDINNYDTEGLYTSSGKYTFTLDSSLDQKLRAVLLGKPVGAFGSAVSVTVEGDTNWAVIGNKYEYKIKAVDAIITDAEDITTPGTSLADAKKIKVTYDYVWHKTDSMGAAHPQRYENAKAVIDLENVNTGIPQSVIDTLRSASVGELGADEIEAASFEITYTEESADKYEVKYIITDINMIYKIESGGLSIADTVASDSIVNITYELKNGNKVIESGTTSVNLGEITGTTGFNSKIKEALIGKSMGTGLNIDAYTETLYREYLADYRTYTLNEIEYFVTEELITSFKFVNKSSRNPFHAESLFLNDLTNENKIYALDSTNSEYVIRLLYGVTMESSSSTTEGMIGAQTVAVGLNATNMQKYGLYANTIYFEMPRGIGYGAEDGDYTVLNTIPFTLYISDLQPDGSRYVGSDMYDIIAKVDGSKFVFLDQSFVEYWARKGLAAVSYEKIDKMTVDFNMTDLSGRYDLTLYHKEMWIVGDNMTAVKPEEGGQRFDKFSIEVSMKDMDAVSSATGTLLTRELIARNKTSLMLNSVYAVSMGVENPVYYRNGYDAMNFQSVLDIMFHTYYTGMVGSKAEQKEIIDRGDKLLGLSFTISDKNYPDTYYYEFYRADDRRILVSIYSHGEKENAVSDFYISTFAFKKIVDGFVDLFNGEMVDGDVAYE